MYVHEQPLGFGVAGLRDKHLFTLIAYYLIGNSSQYIASCGINMIDNCNTDLRLKEFVSYADENALKCKLVAQRAQISDTASWITNNKKRTAEDLIMYNLLMAAVENYEIAITNISGPIQIISLCTRNIYELYLRCRYLQVDSAHFQEWETEACNDKIQILEGFLQLDNADSVANNKNRLLITTERDRLKQVCETHKRKIRSQKNISQIARELGKCVEYKALFKFCSKLIHPTSYLLNSRPDDTQHLDWRNILLIHLQLWAGDLLKNAQNYVQLSNEQANNSG